MPHPQSQIIQPHEWITIIFVAFIGIILNSRLLRKEWAKRNSNHSPLIFSSKFLKYFSVCTLIFGIAYPVVKLCSYIPITCHFSPPLRFISIFGQGVFMGYYQLSRLFYSFSQNKSYSEKGYSSKLFIILYTFGLVIFLNAISFPWLFAVNAECFYNDQYQMVYKYTMRDWLSWNEIEDWIVISAAIYLIWDFFIWYLYQSKHDVY